MSIVERVASSDRYVTNISSIQAKLCLLSFRVPNGGTCGEYVVYVVNFMALSERVFWSDIRNTVHGFAFRGIDSSVAALATEQHGSRIRGSSSSRKREMLG